MKRLRQTARTKRNASASPRHRRERAQMAGGAWGEPRRPNKHARTNVSHETLRGTPRFGAGSRLQLHVEPHGFGRSPTTDPTGPRCPRFDGKTPASWQQSTGLVIPPSDSLDVSRTRAGETPSIAFGKPEAPQPGPRQNCQTGRFLPPDVVFAVKPPALRWTISSSFRVRGFPCLFASCLPICYFRGLQFTKHALVHHMIFNVNFYNSFSKRKAPLLFSLHLLTP